MHRVSVLSRPGGLLACRSVPATLGLQLGILMPVLSGILFPTYYHLMPRPWINQVWLLELHFVAYEIAVIAWAYARGMDRNRMWRALPRDIRWAALLLLAAMFAGSVLISADPAASLAQTLTQVVHLYFAVAVYFLARTPGGKDAGGPDNLVTGLAIGLVVLAFYTLWHFQFPPPSSEVPGGKIEWDFALPGFISVRYLGIWCGAVAAAFLIQILYREENRQVTFRHLAFMFAAAFAMWSGTRAAVLGMAGAAAIFMIFVRWPTRRALIVASGLTAIAFCQALVFQFDHPAFKLVRWSGGGDIDRLSSGRFDLWVATIERWRDSPLLGWGTGSLFWEVYLGWTHTQPHNAILQFLFSWGIVGTIPALWLLGRSVWSAQAIARSQPRFWPLLGMVYALLWMSMVDGALYYPRFVSMIVVGLALVLASAGPNTQTR